MRSFTLSDVLAYNRADHHRHNQRRRLASSRVLLDDGRTKWYSEGTNRSVPLEVRLTLAKRPSTRPDIMGPYMNPHAFRLTSFRIPPKIVMDADGRPVVA